MAAITVTWDPTTPAGNSNIKDGDDTVRTFKTGLVERLRNGGHQMQTAGATTDATDGRHCAGESNAAGSSELAGEFNIYAADTTTVIGTFRDATAATPSEWFAGSLKIRTTGNLTAATGTFSGAVTTGALTAAGHIKPSTDAIYDLGDATHRIRDSWFTGTVTFSGAVVHNAAETFNAAVTFAYATYTATQDIASGTTALAAGARVVFGKLTATATLTLPAMSGQAGREIFVCIATNTNDAVNTLVIDPNGTDPINNVASGTLTLRTNAGTSTRSVHLICDPVAGWYSVAYAIATLP